MIRDFLALVVSPVHELYKKERILELAGGGGRIRVRKSVDYILQQNKKVESIYGLFRSFGG